MLARAVDAGERLLGQQHRQAVALADLAHHLHEQLVVIGGDVGRLVDRRELELVRGDLVVPRLGGDAQAEQRQLEVLHEVEGALFDGAEVVVLKLLALGRPRALEGPVGEHQVGALLVVLGVDEE